MLLAVNPTPGLDSNAPEDLVVLLFVLGLVGYAVLGIRKWRRRRRDRDPLPEDERKR